MRNFVCCTVAVVIAMMPAFGFAQAPAAPAVPAIAAPIVPETPAPETLTPSRVLADPAAVAEKTVMIEGVLDNEGTNFFTDLRLVLKDAVAPPMGSARGIRVRPWLPLSIPPGPPGSPARETLAAFMGKKVVLRGRLQDEIARDVGPTKVLVVEAAQRVE